MWTMQCLNSHKRDAYAASPLERACRTILCADCGETMSPVFSPGTPLVYFGEGGGAKLIHNLGPEPVLVTSHAHHKELMRKAGVDWAPARRGTKGCWGG